MLRTIVIGLVAVAWTATAAPADEPFVHVVGKQPRTLRLDPSRLAIYQSDRAAGNAPRPHPGIPSLGVAPEQARPWPIAGWTLIDTAPVRQREGRNAPIRHLAARAAADPAIDFASPVFVDDLGGPMFPTPDILVAFKPGTWPEHAEETIAHADAGHIIDRNWQGMTGVYRVRSDSKSGADVLDRAADLARMEHVAWAEPDMVFTGRGALIPNDPGFPNCWGLHNTGQFGGVADQDMDGPEAWDITIGSPAIKLVIIDTGVQQDHPDLNQVPGFDATGENGGGGPVNQWDNHGTGVAGCSSAAINNSLGTVGIAPAAPAASARTFISINSSGNWTSNASWTVNSLAWAQSIGARVTNNSNYYGFTSNAIAQKYAETRAAGMIHFASAGNDGLDGFIVYPASLPDVNAVAALTSAGTRASFSNAGPGMFIAAPGVSVYSTDRTGNDGYTTGDYVYFSGTSAASPCAAGVAALVLSFNHFQSALQVENILATTAVDRGPAGYDEIYGWGFVNAHAALLATPPAGPPQPFNLTAPADGATNVSRRPVFRWETAQNATSHTLELADNPAFAAPIFTGGVASGMFAWPGTPLATATTYYWRMTASNPLGSASSVPASASFTTISVPPADFALLSPADGATGLSTTPSIQWAAADYAESYTIRIDNDPDFSSPLVNFNTTMTTYNQLAPLAGATTYYWTVSANNPIGSTPSTPLVRSFTTVPAPPMGFTLLQPPDGAFINTRTPTLSWSASSGAVSYTLLVDDNLNLMTPEIMQEGLASTSYPVPAGILRNETRYYWRVTAFNPAGSVVSTPATATFAVVVPPCQGDANGDGAVNFADISSVLINWGLSGPTGDANFDSMVNFIDITTVLTFWGQVCP